MWFVVRVFSWEVEYIPKHAICDTGQERLAIDAESTDEHKYSAEVRMGGVSCQQGTSKHS